MYGSFYGKQNVVNAGVFDSAFMFIVRKLMGSSILKP